MGEVIYQPERQLLAQNLKNVKEYVNGLTLDLGAGSFDRYSNFFKEKVSRYVRIDRSSFNGMDVIGDGTFLPFSTESFDTLMAVQVLEHTKNPSEILLECNRVLKKEAHLILTVPQYAELHEEPHDFFRYTKYGLEHILNESGFDCVKIKPLGSFYTMMAGNIIRYCIERYSLYQSPVKARLFKIPLTILGRISRFIENNFKNDTALKFPIGWLIVGQKK